MWWFDSFIYIRRGMMLAGWNAREGRDISLCGNGDSKKGI